MFGVKELTEDRQGLSRLLYPLAMAYLSWGIPIKGGELGRVKGP